MSITEQAHASPLMPSDLLREGQLRPAGISDPRVLLAMTSIPREVFITHLNEDHVSLAYRDAEIPIGYDRSLPSPVVAARMLQLAGIMPSDFVLDCASGTGYMAALMSSLASQVVALEQDPDLIQIAEDNFLKLQTQNVNLIHGMIEGGWKVSRQYDVIIINGIIDYLPETFISQLCEGGRLVALVRKEQAIYEASKNAPFLATMRVYKRIKGHLSSRDYYDVITRSSPVFKSDRNFAL